MSMTFPVQILLFVLQVLPTFLPKISTTFISDCLVSDSVRSGRKLHYKKRTSAQHLSPKTGLLEPAHVRVPPGGGRWSWGGCQHFLKKKRLLEPWFHGAGGGQLEPKNFRAQARYPKIAFRPPPAAAGSAPPGRAVGGRHAIRI